MYRACVNLVSAKKKEKNLAILVPMQPKHCNKYCRIVTLLLLVPFRKINVFRYSVLACVAILNTLRSKHFPLADIPDNMNSELSATQVRRLSRQSHFRRTWLNWIRHSRNATYELGLSLTCKRICHCLQLSVVLQFSYKYSFLFLKVGSRDPNQRDCAVFLSKKLLYSQCLGQVYKWVPANLTLGLNLR